MRIGVDGYTLDISQGTGLAAYTRTLQSALSLLGLQTTVVYGRNVTVPASGRSKIPADVALFDVAPQSRLVRLKERLPKGVSPLLSRRSILPDDVAISNVVDTRLLDLREDVRFLNVRDLYRRAYNHFSLYKRPLTLDLPSDVGLMHWTHPFPIAAGNVPNVYTIHDLIPLRLPYTTADRVEYYYSLMQYVTATADILVTVSWTTYRDLISLFPQAAEKTVVTYEALPTIQNMDALWTSDEEVNEVLAGEYGLSRGDYFLFVGAIEPKKNVERLLEAYLASGTKRPLLMVGSNGWYSEAVLGELESLWRRGRRDYVGPGRVVRLNYVSSRRLDTLIRGARALLFPSVYEGFGLPIIEGMSRGTPVMTSNNGATAEIAGDAAALVDPYSVKDIARAIRRLDGDEELMKTLSERGSARADYFSLARYSARLRTAYERVGRPLFT